MDEQYCNNDPCETEATKFYVTSKGVRFYLCHTCAEAFGLGQVNADVAVEDIDDEESEEDEE